MKQVPPKQSIEFQRFSELAQRLIAVPKKEIDQKRIEHERKKTKREKPAK